jgi:anaerobic selenocysteine-containing dehydrogenase
MAARALSRVGLTIDMSTALNTGHIHGRGREAIILPVLARDEEPQSTTQESMFSFVRMSEGGQARHVGPRSEVSIIASIARATLGDDGPIDFASMEEHSTIRRAIAAVVPGYGAIGEIDRTKREFHVEDRALRGAAFRTPSGRAVFHAVPLPPRGPDDELRLMTIRSEGQFNTVVYEEEDAYRGQERRDVILMNAADMSRLGLRDDDRVTVTSAAGEMRGIRVREFDIRAGNAAMYYPEANVLVEWRADARSKTPSFKNVSVKVTKERSLTILEAERPAATGEGSGQRGRLGAC